MSENLSGTYSTVQTLSPGTPRVTVSGTIDAYGSTGFNLFTAITIDAAVFGPAPGHFTITNTGLIESAGPGDSDHADFGIVMVLPGTVLNAGTILAATGIAILGTGGAYVENSKLIEGTQAQGGGNFLQGAGIYLQGAGTISNSGTISGVANGLYLAGGGFVTNTASAIIAGSANDAIGAGAFATVANAGTINGNNGIVLGQGGSVANTGSIISTYAGVAGYGLNVTVTNSGLIDSTGFSAGVALGRNSTSLATQFEIFNTGTIFSGYAGVVLGAGGYVKNQRLIQGYVDGVQVYANYSLASGTPGTGSVNNSGTIINTLTQTSYYAFLATPDPAGVALGRDNFLTNTGLIISRQFGVSGGASIFNDGTIRATGGIFTLTSSNGTNAGNTVSTTEFSTGISTGGNITNAASGYIAGSVGIQLDAAATGSNTISNAGTILATYYGISDRSSDVFGEAITLGTPATITNSGLIRSTARHFVNTYGNTSSGAGIAIGAGGTITNATGGSIIGYNGISAYGSPITISNAGYIAGAGTYSAVFMGAGGQLTNTGTLYAQLASGVNVYNAPGTVSNAGKITANYGIAFQKAGFVSNTGTIIAAGEGIVSDGPAQVTNSGFIDATSTIFDGIGALTGDTFIGAGIALSGGGTVTNQSGGTIIAAGEAIFGYSTAASIFNSGTIEGTGRSFTINGTAGISTGILLLAGGAITNTSGALISGIYGVVLAAADTVNNAGTITGTNGVAIDFANTSGASVLVDNPGAVFNGKVENEDGLGVLILASAATAGSLQNFGTQFTGFDTISIATGAVWDIAEPITGAAAIILGAAAVTLAGSAAAAAQVSLSAPGAVLALTDPSQFAGTIHGFAPGDTIELAGIPFTATSGTFGTPGEDTYTVATAGTLSIDADGTFYNLLIAGATIGQDNFVLSNDLAVTEAACFAAGTRILTAAGALVPVEDLRIGGAVETFSGEAARIVWIGRRSIVPRRHPRPEAVQPILITAGALWNGLPWRDLVVSPDHALYLEGHLIPAKALINGFSVRQLNRETVTYYHIELPEHAVLFAEGAAAESYLETGNRAAFENAAGSLTLHPDFAQTMREHRGCAPFAESGHAVEAARQRILDRARIETTSDPGLQIRYEKGGAIIASRSAIPGEIIADPRDRRRLGVKITSLQADRHDIPLDHPDLAVGWHDPEPDGRWTNGNAEIPLGLLGGSRNLRVSVAATLRYPLRTMGGVRPTRDAGRVA